MFSKWGVDFWYEIIGSKVNVKNLRFFSFSALVCQWNLGAANYFLCIQPCCVWSESVCANFFSEILNYHCSLQWITVNISSLKLSICKSNFCCKKLLFYIIKKKIDHVSSFKIKMNMETNCQFKGAFKWISSELKHLLLDNITDGWPDQIICNIICQASTSESSLSGTGCQSSASHSTLSSESYSALSPSSK